MIDAGANPLPKPKHLLQFARLGAHYSSKSKPKVGLLNIGVESQKGTDYRREAYALLQGEQESFAFIGNVEPHHLFEGECDIAVTDGFTGNLFLKTCEGLSTFIFEEVKGQEEIERKFRSAEYPGAILAGLKSIVIKCHGNAPDEAILRSIRHAVNLLD